MMQLAFINGKTLCIIRNSKGVTIGYLSRKCRISESKIALWEECPNDDYPTIKQGEKIAEILQIPFAGLYLTPENVPDKVLPNIVNMRRFAKFHEVDDSSLNLAIDWLTSLREESIEIDMEIGRQISSAAIPLLSDNPARAGAQLREWLEFDEKEQKACTSARKLYLLIRKKLEQKSILLAQYDNVELDDARGISLFSTRSQLLE